MATKMRRETLENLRYRVFAKRIIENAIDVFKQLPEGDPKLQLRGHLRQYVFNNGYFLVRTPEHLIAPEYKMLIRDDCNGDIYAVDKAYLSFHYRYALKNAGMENYGLAEYKTALKKNESWAQMREFSTYRSIENIMLKQLAEKALPPKLVKAMEINDFRDFVRNNCGEEFAHYRERVSFVKTFIRAREEEFRLMLKKAGTDERYVEALVEKMHMTGEAWGVVVCDENGRQIEGPEFDRHHIIPVYSPHDVASLSEVNKFNHLCLIEKKYHHWLHRLEQPRMVGDTLYFEKIMVPYNAACILDFENFVAHDFDDPKRRVQVQPVVIDNLAILNRIAELTLRYSRLTPPNKRENTPAKYVNSGGKGGR